MPEPFEEAASQRTDLRRGFFRDKKRVVVGSADFGCRGFAVYAMGHDPNTKIVRGELQLDAASYIRSDDGVTTNVDGVFVAGDVYDFRYKQAITAAGLGYRATMDAERYLEALEFRMEALT